MKIQPNLLQFSGNYQWITSSLFFPMDKWSLLLRQIHQFIDETKDDFTCFQVQINCENGENIRMALLTSGENKQQIGKQLTLRFKTFFSSFSDDDSIKKTIQSIFLPYPTAVIEFGLYNMNYDQNLMERYKDQEQISRFIIEVLQAENIDVDTITTFSFYLQICLIKTIESHYKIDADFIFALFTHRRNQHVASTKITNMLNADIDTLTQITQEIMPVEEFENELAWINQWMAFCKNSLGKSIHHYSGKTDDLQKEFIRFYWTYVTMIHEGLGIKGQAENFLNLAVKRTTLAFFQPKNKLTAVSHQQF